MLWPKELKNAFQLDKITGVRLNLKDPLLLLRRWVYSSCLWRHCSFINNLNLPRSYLNLVIFQSRTPLLQSLIGLFELPEDDTIPDEEHFIDIEDTPGYQTAFSQLAFAGKKEHDPVGQMVNNPKIHLAQSLHKLSTACPGRVGALFPQRALLFSGRVWFTHRAVWAGTEVPVSLVQHSRAQVVTGKVSLKW